MNLQRRTGSNGVVYYASTQLETIRVPHAFSTRIGGTSPPPFDSLNLGNPIGCEIQDDYPRILSHYPLLMKAAGCPTADWCRVHQVHGAGVARVERGEAFDRTIKADALVSDDPTRVIAVRTADCVPVLMASGDGRVVAAVHAGWRGVIAGAVTAALVEMNVEPAKVIAAIGPSISFDAFEVGPEVLVEFLKTFGNQAPVRKSPDGKGRVNLRECLRRQLVGAGVSDDHIDISDRCSFRDRDEFYSHRRDNGVTGRMASIIAPRT